MCNCFNTANLSQPSSFNQTQQSNCQYRLLDKSANTPVTYEADDGVVYLTPVWLNQLWEKTHEKMITAQLRSTRDKYLSKIEKGKIYYLFFRVACYKNSLPKELLTNIDWQRPNSNADEERLQRNTLVFQHSFYVYISIAKYPF